MERDTNPGSGPNMNSKAIRGVMYSLYTHKETRAHMRECKKMKILSLWLIKKFSVWWINVFIYVLNTKVTKIALVSICI